MTRAPFALVPLAFVAAACGAPAAERAAPPDAEAEVAPVVLNIGTDQLRVARLVLDLDQNIGRFVEPARDLPLDRVQLLRAGEEPVDLNDALARCNELWGYEITGGAAFVVGQGEGLVTASGSSGCAVCGWAVICPGTCADLGPGEVPRGGDPAQGDVDPAEGDGTTGTGGTSGGGNTSGGASGSSGSGADSGGTGGSHGGVGNPGGWD